MLRTSWDVVDLVHGGLRFGQFSEVWLVKMEYQYMYMYVYVSKLQQQNKGYKKQFSSW